MGKYREDLLPILSEIVGKIPGVVAGKMFGHPGYHLGRKFFTFVSDDGIALKLPRERAEGLVLRPTMSLFEPMEGRPMKEWVVITHADPKDFKEDVELFDEAIAYAASLVK